MKEGWEYKRIGDICTVVGGSTPKTEIKEYWGGENYWVTPAELNGDKYQGATSRTITDLAVQKTNLQLLPAGTILLSSRAPIGKVAITTVPMYCNQGFKNIICPECLLNDFVYWYLFNKTEYLNSLGTGATFKEISKKTTENISIPVPPIAVQQRIVAELDLLTGIIDKQKAQLKELDMLAQSIFYDMFGDPVENERGWEVKTLKDSVYEMFLGPFGSALKTEFYVPKDKSYCMIYEQKHAIRKTMDVETHYIDKSKYDSLRRFEVHSGDFIMSCRGTIGEVYRLPFDAPVGIIHPSLMKIRIKEDVYNPTFFLWLLSKLIKNESTNGNCVQMAITAKELGQRKPIVPPLSLQQSFARKIESIESQKSSINRSIAETRKLFDYTMDKYFG